MARANSINALRGRKRASAAIGYVRRSTDRQEQSIPDQKRAIERYCAEHHLNLLRFYEDDGISGTSSLQRHAFQSMIADAGVASGGFEFVVVYDVKRFGRVDNDEAGYYRHLLRTNGVEVLYVSENFNGDGTDDLLRPVKQWQAREESKDLAKVAIRGMLSKATSGTPAPEIPRSHGPTGSTAGCGSSSSGGGGWMGGAPPFGYDLRYESMSGQFLFYLRYMRDGSKQMFDEQWDLVRTLERRETVAVSRRDRCFLVPSERIRIETIQRIFRMYTEESRGLRNIANVLNEEGVPTSRGPGWAAKYSGRWATSTVRSILTNPVYVGDLVWNRRTDARFFRISNGQAVERRGLCLRRLERNDESDWIVTPDAHPPLVSRRAFELGRKRLTSPRPQNHPRNHPRPQNSSPNQRPSNGATGPRAKFLLSGLGRCARCGNRYQGYTRYPRPRNPRNPRKSRALKQESPNGARCKTLHYACGGYIRQGRATCTLGAVEKDALEQAVVDAILTFYDDRFNGDTDARLQQVVEQNLSVDYQAVDAQRAERRAELERLDAQIRDLVDAITASNAAIINFRLDELSAERDHVEAQLASLEHLAPSEQVVAELVGEASAFLDGLRATLQDESHPEQRRSAMRRCVRSLIVDVDQRQAHLEMRRVPAPSQPSLEAATDSVVVSFARRSRNVDVAIAIETPL